MDPMQAFVTHFRAARYEDLSARVVEAVKITVLDTMGEALAGSAIAPAMAAYHFEKRLPNILARNFEPGFTVDLARKDLGLAVDMARSHDVPVPATSLLHQLYSASSALGEGKNDFASIVKLFEAWAKTEVRGF